MRKTLEDLRPEFAVEENYPLSFNQLTRGRRKPVMWKCSQGHLYPARVHNKLKGTSCPYCNHRLPIPGETDFASQYPDIAAEFDLDANDGKKPEDFLPHCNDYFNWKCKFGHKFRARMNNRVNNNSPCPYCAGEIPIPGENDAAALYPHLAEEYAEDLNDGHKLSEYFPKSNQYANWRCKRGHEWSARIDHRTDGQSCPYCEGLKAIPEETSFAVRHPHMAKQWHPTKNHGRTPSEFAEFSHFEAVWVCPKGHEYPMTIYHRSRGCGCSICSGKRVLAGYNDIQSQAPQLALEWDEERNGEISPSMVALHSNDRYHWKCPVCGHRWTSSPNNRSRGTGCPACKHCCVDPNVNSLAVVNPKLAGEFDLKFNYPLTPRDVAGYDNRDYWWTCDEGHSWQASPANRNKGTGCPYCQHKKPIAGETDLGTKEPELAAQWHPTKNGGKEPSDYLPQSHESVWWQCEEGHEWKWPIDQRVNGSDCPYCAERRPIPGKTDLASLEPELSKRLHPTKNGGKTAVDYFIDYTGRVWWECEQGHSFRASVRAMVAGWRCRVCDPW